MEVLKVGVLDIESNPSLLREKLGVVTSFPVVFRCARGGVYSKLVSYHLLLVSMLFFLVCPMCRSHSASVWISLILFHIEL